MRLRKRQKNQRTRSDVANDVDCVNAVTSGVTNVETFFTGTETGDCGNISDTIRIDHHTGDSSSCQQGISCRCIKCHNVRSGVCVESRKPGDANWSDHRQ